MEKNNPTARDNLKAGQVRSAMGSLRNTNEEIQWKRTARLHVEGCTSRPARVVDTSGAGHLCPIFSIVASHTGYGGCNTPEALRLMGLVFFVFEALRPFIGKLRGISKTDRSDMRDEFLGTLFSMLPVLHPANQSVTIENVVSAFDDIMSASTPGMELPNPDAFGMQHFLLSLVLAAGSAITTTKTKGAGDMTVPVTIGGPAAGKTSPSQHVYVHSREDADGKSEHFWGIHPIPPAGQPKQPLALLTEVDAYARAISFENAFGSVPERDRPTIDPIEEVRRRSGHRLQTWRAMQEGTPLPAPLADAQKSTINSAPAAVVDLTGILGKSTNSRGGKPKTSKKSPSSSSQASLTQAPVLGQVLDPNSPSAIFTMGERVQARMARDDSRWTVASITAVHAPGSSGEYEGPLYDVKFVTNDVETMVPACSIRRHGRMTPSAGQCNRTDCNRTECGDKRNADDFGALLCSCACHTKRQATLARTASGSTPAAPAMAATAAETASSTSAGTPAVQRDSAGAPITVTSVDAGGTRAALQGGTEGCGAAPAGATAAAGSSGAAAPGGL